MSCCKLKDLYKKEHIGVCSVDKSYKHKRLQYAAIDSHISHRELPIINQCNFGSEETNTNICIKDSFSLCATILAIVGTYSNVGNLIFFIENNRKITDTIDVISSFRIKYSVGTTISICKSSTQEEHFIVTVHETSLSYTVPEKQMISIANDFALGDKSMIFYMYEGAVGYSNIIRTSYNSIWISVVSNILNMSGMNGNRFIPIFYTATDECKMLNMNVGTPTVDVNSGIEKIRSQYNSIVSGAISSVSKDGTCYYCSYLESIHSHLCTERKLEFETKLLGQFAEISE